MKRIFLITILFLPVFLFTDDSQALDYGTSKIIATEISASDAGGFQIFIKQLEKENSKYYLRSYRLPADKRMMNIFPLEAERCTIDKNYYETIEEYIREMFESSGKESLKEAYYEQYSTNYLLLKSPAKLILFYARQGPKEEYIGSENAAGFGEVLDELSDKCYKTSPFLTYTDKVNVFSKLLNEFMEIPELSSLRPSLVSGLASLGEWDGKFINDKDPKVRFVFVSNVGTFLPNNSIKWLQNALLDKDAEVITAALLAIKKLPQDMKNKDLRDKVEQVMKDRWNDTSGMLGKALGYKKYPIREIAEKVLREWHNDDKR